MANNPSRGDSPSAYFPGFDGTSGVKMRLNEMKGQAINGAIISAGVTYAVAHQLDVAPTMILIAPELTKAESGDPSGEVGNVGLAAASAATADYFYVIGNSSGIKYRAFLLL